MNVSGIYIPTETEKLEWTYSQRYVKVKLALDKIQANGDLMKLQSMYKIMHSSMCYDSVYYPSDNSSEWHDSFSSQYNELMSLDENVSTNIRAFDNLLSVVILMYQEIKPL